ncbi:MAG: hypothetical protein K8I02_13705, partial [Candidatus Methylomirabilis sp.]|nr:hypothetical protein [Deltaproteobacteria bacterium]
MRMEGLLGCRAAALSEDPRALGDAPLYLARAGGSPREAGPGAPQPGVKTTGSEAMRRTNTLGTWRTS